MGNAAGRPVSVGPSPEVAEELAAKDKEIAILKHKIYELDIHRSDDDLPINSVTVPHTNSVTFNNADGLPAHRSTDVFDPDQDLRGGRSPRPRGSVHRKCSTTNFDPDNAPGERMLAFADTSGNSTAFRDTASVTHLPRGGVILHTEHGDLQFGSPPETIKDAMSMGFSVPTNFVIPRERFSLKRGVSVCEIEFPSFFNFFILKRKINLICTPKDQNAIIRTMEEALEGPAKKYMYTDNEYGPLCPPEIFAARPDHWKECEYFKEPRPPDTEPLTQAKLISFTNFDEDGKARIGQHLQVVDKGRGKGFYVYDLSLAAAEKSKPGLIKRPSRKLREFEGAGAVGAHESEAHSMMHGVSHDDENEEATERREPGLLAHITDQDSMSVFPPNIKELDKEGVEKHISAGVFLPAFYIPNFGVTILGSSHGFDKTGSTSGFVVWVHGRGIMVDPPPFSGRLLRSFGISPQAISALILTHIHADHDAGTMQKILEDTRVEVMTTKTIMESFVRKYAAVSSLSPSVIWDLFVFSPVTLEEPIHRYGATLRFFYSLHALPCVGVEIRCATKRIVYSADTYYDPDGIEKMKEKGVLSAARAQRLIDFPFDCDVVLHEAGVPPIHTPVTVLAQLPEDVRKNHLHLIHIGGGSAKEAEEKHGMRVAKPGVENTIRLEVPESHNALAIDILGTAQAIDLFRNFNINQCIQFLESVEVDVYEPDTVIVDKGRGLKDNFYLIMNGVATVSTDSGYSRPVRRGDYFCELLNEGDHGDHDHATPTIKSITALTVMRLEKFAFHRFLSQDARLRSAVEAGAASRRFNSREAIEANSVLRSLSSSQKHELQNTLHDIRHVHPGEALFSADDQRKVAMLVCRGEIEYYANPGDAAPAKVYKKGTMFANMCAMRMNLHAEKSTLGDGTPRLVDEETERIIGGVWKASATPPPPSEEDELETNKNIARTAAIFEAPREEFMEFAKHAPVVLLAMEKSCVIR